MTRRPYRRGEALKIEGRGDTKQPQTGNAFPTDHLEVERTSCSLWAPHTEGISVDSIEFFSPNGCQGLWGTPIIHPVRRSWCSQHTEGGPEELQQQERVQWVQEEEPSRHFPGPSTSGQRGKNGNDKWLRGHWPKHKEQRGKDYQAQARSLEDNHHPCVEISMHPVQKVPRNTIASDWPEWHSEKSASTRKSPNSSFINYHFRDLFGRLART